MTESRTDNEPVSWHWSDNSIEAILKKSVAVRRIRNKIKEDQRNRNRNKA